MPVLLTRRGLLGLGAGVLAWLGEAGALAGGTATGASLSGSARLTRLSISLTGTQSWKVTARAGPSRLILDLPGIAWRGGTTLRGAGLVSRARFSAANGQLTLELARSATVRRGAVRDGRLVIDIVPASSAAFARLARKGQAVASGTARVAAPLPLVVVDAGHGGRDPGAIGTRGTQEKRITLAAALELKRQLEAGRRCRVALTRSRDVFVPLGDRVEFARRRQAALFISLHADSAPGARGASVYTLNETASDSLAAGLAKRENEADRAGGLRLPSVPPEVEQILLSLVRQETRAGSAQMARLAVSELGEAVPLLPNTHRQASFVVLKAPEVPSLLVEMGFLSDPRDEAALRQKQYRAKVAAALTRAVNGWLAGTRGVVAALPG